MYLHNCGFLPSPQWSSSFRSGLRAAAMALGGACPLMQNKPLFAAFPGTLHPAHQYGSLKSSATIAQWAGFLTGRVVGQFRSKVTYCPIRGFIAAAMNVC